MNLPRFREADGRLRRGATPVPLHLVACSVGLLALLSGCAAGPDFRTPTLSDEAGYRAEALPAATAATDGPTGDAQRFLEGAPVPAQWWTGFGSEELNRRVSEALANSPTVASAQAALRKAQEEAGVARGQLFPSVDAALGANRQKNPVTTGGGFSSSPYTVYNASVDVGYTLDLFGGVRRGVRGGLGLLGGFCGGLFGSLGGGFFGGLGVCGRLCRRLFFGLLGRGRGLVGGLLGHRGLFGLLLLVRVIPVAAAGQHDDQ